MKRRQRVKSALCQHACHHPLCTTPVPLHPRPAHPYTPISKPTRIASLYHGSVHKYRTHQCSRWQGATGSTPCSQSRRLPHHVLKAEGCQVVNSICLSICLSREGLSPPPNKQTHPSFAPLPPSLPPHECSLKIYGKAPPISHTTRPPPWIYAFFDTVCISSPVLPEAPVRLPAPTPRS